MGRALLVACCVLIIALPQRPLVAQPQPDASEYASSAAHLAAGDGYIATVTDRLATQLGPGRIVPRYPPGFPILLAAVPSGLREHWVPKVVMVLLAIAVWILAHHLAGPLAAATAAVLVVLSPFSRTTGLSLMTDALSALIGITVVLTVRRHPRLAGLLAGYSVLVRLPNLVLLAGALLVAPPGGRSKALRWALPPLALLVAFQWQAFGSPFATGYRTGAADFGLRYVTPRVLLGIGAGTPNFLFYPAVLLGVVTAVLPPIAPVFAIVEAWQRRETADARFLAALAAGSLALYVPYFFRDPRFMAPVAMVEMAFAGAFVARVADRRPVGPVVTGAR